MRPHHRLAVGINDLVRHPGVQHPVELQAPIENLDLFSSRVPAGSEVTVDVVVEALADGTITVTGQVRAPWTGECRRCLREVTGELTADVREVFERSPSEGDTYPIDGDVIDLEPMARDAVLLNLPLAPLCSSDCAGPAPEAFPVVEGDAGPEVRDPRWAGLDSLRFEPDDT